MTKEEMPKWINLLKTEINNAEVNLLRIFEAMTEEGCIWEDKCDDYRKIINFNLAKMRTQIQCELSDMWHCEFYKMWDEEDPE